MKKLFYLVIITSLIGCDIDSETLVSDAELPPDEATLSFLESQGFPRNEVVLQGSNLIIGGDGFLPLEDVKKAMLSNSSGRTQQYRATFIASSPRAGFILVYVKPNVAQAWKDAVTAAMAEWNNLNKDVNPLGEAGVFFIKAASENAHLVISSATLPVNTYASAQYPDSYGYVGESILVSTIPPGGVALKRVMMHELGHVLGLRHSDWYKNGSADSKFPLGAVLVPGTLMDDPSSIMNSNYFYLPNSFSSNDKLAIKTLWPWDWWQ